MKSSVARKETLTYRWFRLGILLGVGLAILLLVNSVANYFLGSRRVLVEQRRRDLASQVASLDRQIQQASPESIPALGSLLEQVRQSSHGKIAWIQICSLEGAAVASAGPALGPVFPTGFVRSQLRNRQPVFQTLKLEAGEVVVEAFAFRLPVAVRPSVVATTTMEPRPPQPLAIVEIAMLLDGRRVAFWPLRRNLMINCSGVFALLVSLTVMSVRFRSYAEGKQLEKQVEIARQVQQDLLGSPKRLPEQFQLAAECRPASGVGGDFYDVFLVNDEGAAVVLGDVSGKGIPAALLMGVIHGAVRSSPWTESPRHHEESTRQINRLLWERASRERYATMFWAYFDPDTRLLHYVNAGHLPPLLFRAGVETPLRLHGGGPVLGLLPGARFEQAAVRLEPGDVLVLYSDGVVEAVDAAGEEFGQERLCAMVTPNLDKTAGEIRDDILRSVEAFTGQTALDDDRTLLVIRYQNIDARQTEGPRSAFDTKLAAQAA